MITEKQLSKFLDLASAKATAMLMAKREEHPQLLKDLCYDINLKVANAFVVEASICPVYQFSIGVDIKQEKTTIGLPNDRARAIKTRDRDLAKALESLLTLICVTHSDMTDWLQGQNKYGKTELQRRWW